MNAFILLTSMMVSSVYMPGDFHYYDESAKGCGLSLVNKLYVNGSDKKKFLDFVENVKTLERFKDIKTEELDGLMLFFKDSKDAMELLNKSGGFQVSPVVVFDGIESAHKNEIIVRVHPSVNKEDFLVRLHGIAEGNFEINEFKPKSYLIKVKDLKNPSNVLILANLLAKDNVWVKHAMVNWIPINGYVKAFATVETPAISHLGEMRNLKVVINVFDPDIKVRTDLLPQMGQSFSPFPFAGDIWFDAFPMEVKETKYNRGKTLEITYPFRQLQFGSYAFQPILVSYEKDGDLRTTKTEVCRYDVRSVIAGTDIEDIQPRTNDGLDLPIFRPTTSLPAAENKYYNEIKIAVSGVILLMGTVLLISSISSLRNRFANLLRRDPKEELWKDLISFWKYGPFGRQYYLNVSHKLNELMNEVFYVSLYSVDLNECTDDFRVLAEELNKVYKPDPVWNEQGLNEFVSRFCKERRYK